jgi:hypothetical protein
MVIMVSANIIQPITNSSLKKEDHDSGQKKRPSLAKQNQTSSDCEYGAY